MRLSLFCRNSLLYLVITALAMPALPATVAAQPGTEAVVAPAQAPENIPQLINAFHHIYRIKAQRNAVGAGAMPGEVKDLAESKVFIPGYLEHYADYFREEAAFLGAPDEVERFAFKMFEQWLYLEIFRLRRLEYLTVNYAKALGLSDLSAAEALARFDQYLPADNFAHFAELNDTRESLRQQLADNLNDAEARKSNREYLRGVVEGAYLTLATLSLREEQLRARFSDNDERFVKGMENIEAARQAITHSSAILMTDTFADNVEPFFNDETMPAARAQEAVVNSFNRDIQAYLEAKTSVTDLYEYLSNRALRDLSRDLAEILSTAAQSRFRDRIEQNFSAANNEVLAALEETLTEYRGKFQLYAFPAAIVDANASSVTDVKEFRRWLIEVFEEQVLHWLIVEEFPFMEGGAEALTKFVTEEMSAAHMRRLYQTVGAVAVFSASPLGRIGNPFSSWMGRRSLQFWRLFNVGAKGVLAGSLGYDTYLRYLDWQRTSRLARINLEGAGLTSLIQAEGAFWSMVAQGAMAGVVGLFSLSSSRGYWRAIEEQNKKMNAMFKAGQRMWDNRPIPMAAFQRHMSMSLSKMRQAITQLQFKAANGHLMTIGADIGAILTQFFLMVPARMPGWVRGFLASVPLQVYRGISLGTVMGIMGVTVQSYITAAGLKGFVWSFEKLGFTPPPYWQQSTLNQMDLVKRSAFNTSYDELTWSKNEVAQLVGSIAMWEKLAAEADTTEQQRADLQAAIAAANESINEVLKTELLRWYLYFEFRQIKNSIMKDLGYAILATPSADDPVRITIMLRIGARTVAYEATVSELEDLLERKALPDLNMSAEELEGLAETLRAN